eukprot:scaffold94881_cov24-Phaeocystis_antarctica.AAC.1
MASAILGLVGQPRLQKYVQESIGTTGMLGQSGCAPSRGQARGLFDPPAYTPFEAAVPHFRNA